MPLNCIPVTTTRAALDEKLAACQGQLWVDCGFFAGVVPGNAAELPGLIEGGVLGAKAFMCPSGIDDFPASTQADLAAAMPRLAAGGIPLLVHAELEDGHGDSAGPHRAYSSYLGSRPRAWEDNAIALIIGLCRDSGCAVHIVHLSSASAIDSLRNARAEGLPITVETCPHYLCLTAEEVSDGATEFKCAPPIREADNREGLWQGLREGVIDSVVSDHSPCTPQLKQPERGDFMGAWGGIASLQLGLSAVWTEARARGLGPVDVSRWMSAGPARIFGLHDKGSLSPGCDADLVAWAPEASFTVTPESIHHRHKVTPYAGRTLHGRVRKTWLRGEVVFADGQHVARAGRIIRRTAP